MPTAKAVALTLIGQTPSHAHARPLTHLERLHLIEEPLMLRPQRRGPEPQQRVLLDVVVDVHLQHLLQLLGLRVQCVQQRRRKLL